MLAKTQLSAKILLVLTLVGASWSSEPPQATDVLVGTDTRKLDSFKFQKRALTLGAYVAETGGANTTLVIREAPAGTFNVTRTFAEPGERPRVKTYQGVQRGADGIYRKNRQLEIRVPEGGGILVLERASGVESIPGSLWVWFKPKIGGVKK
jgi:hypothetical protein